jgi:type III secretion system FlhB-like substrate exporter
MKKYKEILKLADEYEEKLKKWVKPKEIIDTEDEYKELLLSLDIIPLNLPSSKNSSIVGFGASAIAMKVLFKGKEAIAKLSHQKSDIENLKKISDLKDKLPSNLKKHLPEVYFTRFSNNPATEPHIAIVEELYPTNKHVLSVLFAEFPRNKWQIIVEKFQNKSFVRQLVGKFLSFPTSSGISNIFKSRMKDGVNLLTEFFYKYQYPEQYMSFDPVEFSDSCKDILEFLFVDLDLDLDQQQEIDIHLSLIKNEIYSFWKRIVLDYDKYKFNALFPGSSESDLLEIRLSLARQFPEARSLIKLLTYLKDSFGVYWEDLHEGNIMQRKNGDLVISDVGLFRI